MDRPGTIPPGQPSGGPRWLRVLLMPVLALALVTGLSGCQIVIGMLMMLQGLPTVDSDFKRMTKKSLDEKGKKVMILCTSAPSALQEHPSLDVDMIASLTRLLHAQKINVVDSHEITKHIDDNGGIDDATDLAAIAPKFKADYIVLIKFNSFTFREPNSPGLYRGQARGKAVVVELGPPGEDGKRAARPIYNKPFDSKYPINQPISTEQEKPSVFKQRYLSKLAEEIGRLFYDHRPGEDM